jgi:NADH-quinone oxidoreductase subunit N
MNTIIVISVLPIVLLYLGLYKMQKALLPVTIVGLLVALGLAIAKWNTGAVPEYHGMILFNNFSVIFSSLAIISTLLKIILKK